MLSVVSIDESNKWDEIVRSFKEYDVYYLSNYTRAFKIHGDGEPTLFYYEDEYVRAINVVMKRDIGNNPKFEGKIPLNTHFDLTTPYGYGGFLIEGKVQEDTLKNIFLEYNSYCKNNGIISEFVRFHPILNNSKGMEFTYDIKALGKTVSIKLKSKEYIWDNLTSKNRNVIRKAKKSGIEIYWGRNRELIDEFIDMYNATMYKDNADEYYYFKEDFYNSILNDLKYNFLMFYAVHEKKIIAMSMILFSNNQMHYHLSASIREYLTYAPTNLLLYEAACWGANNGYDTLHLGGGLGSKEDSLYKFKKAFNKDLENDFDIGRKIFDVEKYKKLVEMRKNEEGFDEDGQFFPIYRG
ncbi:GNAT family N-acetyltransferase [Tissierella pigra]|uniref:lipid II:glycine glycyltransferase FemX n=1 Tax=Tissierella pigra TaxID=2607614 RepID=UPI001C0FCBA9|nr:GNAT family N-acetyltransferase [Tissierella pigra]MBU5427917.1 GNAT family N-acetyltransferase [Tissierella pigra]